MLRSTLWKLPKSQCQFEINKVYHTGSYFESAVLVGMLQYSDRLPTTPVAQTASTPSR